MGTQPGDGVSLKDLERRMRLHALKKDGALMPDAAQFAATIAGKVKLNLHDTMHIEELTGEAAGETEIKKTGIIYLNEERPADLDTAELAAVRAALAELQTPPKDGEEEVA